MEMLSIAFIFVISLGVPLGGFIYLCVRKRHLLVPSLLGALTFFVFQMLTRIPLIQILSTQPWYLAFARARPIVYSFLIGGLSAGVFEELGRLAVMLLLMKKYRSWADGAAHGLGHGGFEALMLVGLNTAVALALQPDALFSQGAFALFLGGVERISAMLFHLGASVLVMRGIQTKRYWTVLVSILLHTLFNGPIALFQLAGAPNWLMELYFLLFGLAMLFYTLAARRKEKRQQALPAPQVSP